MLACLVEGQNTHPWCLGRVGGAEWRRQGGAAWVASEDTRDSQQRHVVAGLVFLTAMAPATDDGRRKSRSELPKGAPAFVDGENRGRHVVQIISRFVLIILQTNWEANPGCSAGRGWLRVN